MEMEVWRQYNHRWGGDHGIIHLASMAFLSKKSPKSPEKDDTPSKLEWDHDSSSKACVLCRKTFTMTFRRHHCRHCGRLVCQPCSSKRLVLTEREMKGELTILFAMDVSNIAYCQRKSKEVSWTSLAHHSLHKEFVIHVIAC